MKIWKMPYNKKWWEWDELHDNVQVGDYVYFPDAKDYWRCKFVDNLARKRCGGYEFATPFEVLFIKTLCEYENKK